MQKDQIKSLGLLDYPQIARGLNTLEIKTLTDFQEQFLKLTSDSNMIVCAPEGSGKLISIMILTLKLLFNEEEQCILILAHSKELSQKCTHILATLSNTAVINLYMQKIPTNLPSKSILVGNPLHGLQIKSLISKVIIPQAQLLLNFGFKDSLYQLAHKLPPETKYQLICNNLQAQVLQFKQKIVGKVLKIDYHPPTQEIQNQDKVDCQVNHFFSIGDAISVPISLYVSLKFGLVNPKVLVLCQNIIQVYRYNLFLERAHIQNAAVYNHLNPINLKLYTLSLWNSGSTNILLATNHILQDLHVFAKTPQFHRVTLPLNNLTTIIQLNIINLEQNLSSMLELFPHKPLIMSFVNTKLSGSIELLVESLRQQYSSVKSSALPLTSQEVDSFRYRINDLFMSVGNKKAEWSAELDLKRKMLRSPDLKQYFQENPHEKASLAKSVISLSQKIDYDKVTISQHLPSYLIPDALKTLYQQQVQQIQQEQPTPTHHRTIQSTLKKVDLEEENPQITDYKQLKIISARKRWKLQHGFKLNKRNIRNQKKGIFQKN